MQSSLVRSEALLFRGVFWIAFATLLFEVALIRVLSFTIWYHFAYVAISTALLGYGASGSLLAVRPGIGAANLQTALRWSGVCAAASVLLVLGVISTVPLDPMQITSSARHASVFVLYLVVVTIPFFFSGLAISLSMRAAAERIDRLYFWDLVGAALGACLAVAVMNAISPPGAILVAAAAFAIGGAAFSPSGRRRVAVLVAAAALLAAAPLAQRVSFRTAASKHLAIGLDRLGMTHVFQRWTALFRTDVIALNDVSRSRDERGLETSGEWGLSSIAPRAVQRPWGFVTHDGTAGTPVYDLHQGPLDFLDLHIIRMPYLLIRPAPRVLVIGVGGGRDVLAALRYGASEVTGVELDPVTVELVQDDLLGVAGGVFRGDRVRLVVGEGRHFVRRSRGEFDLIQITGVDTLAAQSSGAYVLAENYLYTVEAFSDYLDHLAPDGLLCVTNGHLDDNHPNVLGRMLSVAREALARRGSPRPADHVAIVTSSSLLANVLVKPTPFTPQEIRRLADEAARLRFRPLWLPGGPSHPAFARLAEAVEPERQAVLAKSRYVLETTTDDNPFFFRSYRWSDLFIDPLGPVHTTALGQLVLVALLIALSTLGLLLILGPLIAFGRRGIAASTREKIGIAVYFLAIGLGFMLFEISLIQQFVLFLGYPTYSLTITLASVLVFLGMGSRLSRRWLGSERTLLPVAVLGIGVMALFYAYGLPRLQESLLGAPLPVRAAVTVLVLAPLGLLLGAFLPLGIRCAASAHPDLVPWAWGINGCASVTGTVLAVVLAMTFGFARVWTLSVVIYAIGVGALLWSGTWRRRAVPSDLQTV